MPRSIASLFPVAPARHLASVKKRLGLKLGVIVTTAGMIVASMLVAAVPPAGAASTTTPAFPGGASSALPSNATTSGANYVNFTAVSCVSAGNCLGGGTYSTDAAGALPFVAVETNGIFAAATEAPLPSNALTGDDAFGQVEGLSCTSVSNCTGVGVYESASSELGLIETETNGNWAATQVTLPANAAPTDQEASLLSVSCSAVGNCSAVGSYTDTSSDSQLLVDTESNGTWTASEVSSPANSETATESSFTGVSCASTGNCTAVGYYATPDDLQEGLFATQTNGTFAIAAEVGTPITDTSVALSDVSCASAGNCTAVGNYYTNEGVYTPIFATEANGTFATPAATGRPSNASTTGTDPDYLTGVSCTSVGNCTAIGSYLDSASNFQAYTESEVSGSFSSPTELTAPSNAVTDPDSGVNAVSCTNAVDCTVVGQYATSTTTDISALESFTAFTLLVAPPPAGIAATSLGTPTSVTLVANTAATVTGADGNGSATVSIPAGALPPGTVVSLYPVTTTTLLASQLPAGKAYLLSFAVSWITPTGTSPISSSPLTMVVTNASIYAGDVVYEVTGSTLTAVSTATASGSVTITFSNDPTFTIAATPKASLFATRGSMSPKKKGFTFEYSCQAGANCTGTAKLDVTRSHKSGKKTVLTHIVIASTTFSIQAGQHGLAKFGFTKAGRALFARRDVKKHYRMSLLTRNTGGTATAHTAYILKK